MAAGIMAAVFHYIAGCGGCLDIFSRQSLQPRQNQNVYFYRFDPEGQRMGLS